MSERQRRFVLISGMFFAILLCLSGSTAAVFLAQRILQEDSFIQEGAEKSGEGDEAAFLSQQGVLITSVDPASPAGQADLRRGQIILRMDGIAVEYPQELQQMLQGHETGDAFTLDILSGPQTRTVTLIASDQRGYLGAGLLDASATLSSSYDLPGSANTPPISPETGFSNPGFSQTLFLRAVVLSLVADSPAEKAGLQAGDIITNVDEAAILTNDELITAIGSKSAGEIVVITFRRGANTLTETITLAEHPDDAGRGFLGVRLQPVAPAGAPD